MNKGEKQSVNADQENWRKWSQLVAQSWADERLKQRLLTKPAAVLREHGIELPAGTEVRVVEATEKLYYFVLPPKPADVMELTSSQLSGVGGGMGNVTTNTGVQQLNNSLIKYVGGTYS